MKSIVLIGDEANAKKFINGLEQFKKDEPAVSVRYQPSLEKAVNSTCSAFVVINANNGRIPDSIVAYLPRIPSDHVYYYSPDKTPESFLKEFVSELKSVDTFQNKLKFFLFGGEQSSMPKKRHMSMQVGQPRKTPAL